MAGGRLGTSGCVLAQRPSPAAPKPAAASHLLLRGAKLRQHLVRVVADVDATAAAAAGGLEQHRVADVARRLHSGLGGGDQPRALQHRHAGGLGQLPRHVLERKVVEHLRHHARRGPLLCAALMGPGWAGLG
jgi:hypothetical protein